MADNVQGIYLGNLPVTSSEDDVRALFCTYGEVVEDAIGQRVQRGLGHTPYEQIRVEARDRSHRQNVTVGGVQDHTDGAHRTERVFFGIGDAIGVVVSKKRRCRYPR